MPNCSSCRASITWAASATSGKPMPLDAQPAPDGNIVLDQGRARVLSRLDVLALDPAVKRYRSHHSTCPHAGQWRAPKVEKARG